MSHPSSTLLDIAPDRPSVRTQEAPMSANPVFPQASRTDLFDPTPPAGAARSTPTFRIPAPAPMAPVAAPVRVRPSRATYLRRRIVAGLAVLLVAVALVLFGDAVMAQAGGGAAPTGGHAVVEPGQTLWDIAVAHTPDGGDARGYLQDLKDLNGLSGADVDAWTVVLLPR